MRLRTTFLSVGQVALPEGSRDVRGEDADRRAAQIEWWTAQNGRQGGDPAKLSQALLLVASEEPPRHRFIAGADAIATVAQNVADLEADIKINRERYMSLDVTEA